MQTIEFKPPADSVHHECEAYRDGNWIIFRCPHCYDYERRLNWRTGEMNSRHSRAEVHHTGKYFPKIYREAFENSN
jgi:hypothetical protein